MSDGKLFTYTRYDSMSNLSRVIFHPLFRRLVHCDGLMTLTKPPHDIVESNRKLGGLCDCSSMKDFLRVTIGCNFTTQSGKGGKGYRKASRRILNAFDSTRCTRILKNHSKLISMIHFWCPGAARLALEFIFRIKKVLKIDVQFLVLTQTESERKIGAEEIFIVFNEHP